MIRPFTAYEFLRMPPQERARWCKAIAVEAAKISAASQSRPLGTAYRILAMQLCVVADEIGREGVPSQARGRELRDHAFRPD